MILRVAVHLSRSTRREILATLSITTENYSSTLLRFYSVLFSLPHSLYVFCVLFRVPLDSDISKSFLNDTLLRSLHSGLYLVYEK